MLPDRWLTMTRLRRELRRGGCMQGSRHARAMLTRGHAASCHAAHPPTPEDELAARQRWFVRVPRATRRLFTRRWQKTSTQRSRPMRTFALAGEFSPRVAEGNKEFAYRSTWAILPEDRVQTIS